jgi:hypothetical protein
VQLDAESAARAASTLAVTDQRHGDESRTAARN